MNALARKRWRDLWHLRGQVLATALVAAVGIANLVMSRATLDSLQSSRDRYYRDFGFADAFVEIKRAPLAIAARLADIPGVTVADPRIVAFGRAELPGFDDPIRVEAVSVPDAGKAHLNRLHLFAGEIPAETDRAALVLSDAFAAAHGLRPGDSLTLVLRGRRQSFRIAGIGASPEFVAQLAPQTVFPDARRFAIVWIPRRALEAATDLRGAFNSVTFALAPDVRPERVFDRIDRELARYGGAGVVGRADQRSHRYLSEEFRQLKTMATLFPSVFLAVAAFVLYVVLGRLVAGQREQIGTLKAFGYTRREIWRHFAGFGVAIGVLGGLLGVPLGAYLGELIAGIYREFYRLPFLDFRLAPGIVLLAFAVSVGSALVGAAVPVWRAARLPPAEAMRPDIPWRAAGQGVVGAGRLRKLAASHRLIARNLLQRPLRTLLTVLGLAAGTAIMMMGRFQNDAVDRMVQVQFERADRQDISVAFVEPVAATALHELAALPDVRRAEPERAVPVRVRFRAASYRTALVGLAPTAQLRRSLDDQGRPMQAPLRGLLLTDYLARWLGARPGDILDLETLDGRRRVLRLPLAGVVSEAFGVQAYLPIATLDRELGEGERITSVNLTIDRAGQDRLFARIERRPAVAALAQRREGIRNFYDSMAETILTFTFITLMFGMVITAGVVYSSARVALSERSRDLASLRVLGFTRAEVGYLLLGELALLTTLALPVGFVLGNLLIDLLVRGFDSDLFRIPHYVSPATYGIAGVATLVTALACAGLVWRRVGELDLIGVLKARD